MNEQCDQHVRSLGVFSLLAVACVLSGCGGMPDGPAGNVTDVEVSYFGCGCFWHVQHAMITGAERPIIGRSGSNVTAFTGYAGGSGSDQGRVCYHASGITDYGALGYAEVASLQVSEAEIEAVAEYFFTSVCINGIRQDTQDRGAEYRSLVGFPGGIGSVMGNTFKTVGESHGVTVAAGSGSDPDTSGTVYVMDSHEFPFHQAEVYHQFHDDMTARYSSDYHGLSSTLLSQGTIQHTGCPSDAVEVATA